MKQFSKYGIFYSYTEEQTSMTMPSEMQPVSYQQEGEYDMTESAPLMQSTPRHERGSQSTLTTVSELILVSTVDEPSLHHRVVLSREVMMLQTAHCRLTV